MILVTVSGAHLHKQALGEDTAPTAMAAPHSSDPLIAEKAAARRLAICARAGCDPALGAELGRRLLTEAPPPAGAVVSGFWPLEGEIDIRPLLHELVARGHRVVLPVTPKRGFPLAFRRWQPGEPLAAGRFGTVHPEGEELPPDLLLVPLLAFDRRGNRLGYGAGYYDRTIAGLPDAVTIGCAFAAQEMEAVPAGPTDRRLAMIATETGVIRCERAE